MFYCLERDKDTERNICGLHMPQLGLNLSPGVSPDLESNPQPSSAQDDAQPTGPHQPGLQLFVKFNFYKYIKYNFFEVYFGNIFEIFA